MRVYAVSGSYEEAVTAVEAIGWKPLFKKSDYKGVSKKLAVQCKCKNKLQVSIQKLSKSGECSKCKGRTTHNNRKLTTRDGEFHNIGAAAKYYGINRGSLTSRLQLGWTDEEACGLLPRKIDRASRNPDARGFIYKITNERNGLVYIGLTSVSVARRWKGHLRDSRSRSTAPLHQAIRDFGKDAFTIRCIAEAPIKELPELEKRLINKHKSLDPEFGYNGAIGGGLGGPALGHSVVHKRKVYASRREFSEAIGVSYELVRKLFLEGLNPEQVAKEGKRRSKRGYHQNKEITVRGKRYASIKEACEIIGVGRDAVNGRLRMGWSLDEAFTPGKFTKATSPKRLE